MNKENKIDTHPLLYKQLQRLALNSDEVPPLSQWQDLLKRVSSTYTDADQERYLLERSLEISSREILELTSEQVKDLNHRLLETARLAGMSEVATSVLHNIGNALNSAHVSYVLIKDCIKGQIKDSYVEKLKFIAEMLKENANKKIDYLQTDPKGKLIPTFLLEISNILIKRDLEFEQEIESMGMHLEHIKNIVVIQREITNVAGVREKVFIPEVVDMALQLSFGTGSHANFKIVKDLGFSGFSILDRSKLLQILINILRNAKEAFPADTENEVKNIKISSRRNEKSCTFEIVIEDSGVGIAAENLTQIFSFGFTTKVDAHGFGLHSSALAAAELGGHLTVKSDGIGKGSAFIIELPYNTKVTTEIVAEKESFHGVS